MTKLTQLKKQMDDMKAQMLAESKLAFNETTKSLFEKYPKLESFSWRQYTPYFNDGDECTFSAHTDSLDLVWDGQEHEDVSDWSFKYEHSDIKGNAEMASFNKEVQAMFNELDSEFLKAMFGDHVKITAKKDGVSVDDYEHD